MKIFSVGDMLAIALLVFIVGAIGGVCVSDVAAKDEAVKSGHAEYVLHGSEAVWQWKSK